MKMPRDVSGEDLARRLTKYGYAIVRQTGSHLRLSTSHGDEHHITIPLHGHLKVGILSHILADVAAYLGITKEELVRELF